MEYKDKVAVVTGGAYGIGKCIAEEFRKKGASVEVIDMRGGEHFVGDISKKEVLEAFADEVIGKYGKVDFIINNAMPLMKGLDECTWEEFQYALTVGVTAPFYLVKLLVPYLAEGASIVNISSSRDRWSQAHSRQHPRCPYPHDCREPNGGERRDGKGCGEFDKPGESVKKRYNLVKTNKS